MELTKMVLGAGVAAAILLPANAMAVDMTGFTLSGEAQGSILSQYSCADGSCSQQQPYTKAFSIALPSTAFSVAGISYNFVFDDGENGIYSGSFLSFGQNVYQPIVLSYTNMNFNCIANPAFSGTCLDYSISTNFTVETSQTAQAVLASNLAPVPEPATWAMMISGFALIGAVMRRRQKTAVRYA